MYLFDIKYSTFPDLLDPENPLQATADQAKRILTSFHSNRVATAKERQLLFEDLKRQGPAVDLFQRQCYQSLKNLHIVSQMLAPRIPTRANLQADIARLENDLQGLRIQAKELTDDYHYLSSNIQDCQSIVEEWDAARFLLTELNERNDKLRKVAPQLLHLFFRAGEVMNSDPKLRLRLGIAVPQDYQLGLLEPQIQRESVLTPSKLRIMKQRLTATEDDNGLIQQQNDLFPKQKPYYHPSYNNGKNSTLFSEKKPNHRSSQYENTMAEDYYRFEIKGQGQLNNKNREDDTGYPATNSGYPNGGVKHHSGNGPKTPKRGGMNGVQPQKQQQQQQQQSGQEGDGDIDQNIDHYPQLTTEQIDIFKLDTIEKRKEVLANQDGILHDLHVETKGLNGALSHKMVAKQKNADRIRQLRESIAQHEQRMNQNFDPNGGNRGQNADIDNNNNNNNNNNKDHNTYNNQGSNNSNAIQQPLKPRPNPKLVLEKLNEKLGQYKAHTGFLQASNHYDVDIWNLQQNNFITFRFRAIKLITGRFTPAAKLIVFRFPPGVPVPTEMTRTLLPFVSPKTPLPKDNHIIVPQDSFIVSGAKLFVLDQDFSFKIEHIVQEIIQIQNLGLLVSEVQSLLSIASL